VLRVAGHAGGPNLKTAPRHFAVGFFLHPTHPLANSSFFIRLAEAKLLSIICSDIQAFYRMRENAFMLVRSLGVKYDS